MIDSGLPLVQCLDILASQQENKTFKAVVYKVKEDVESGSTFADALGQSIRKAFDDLYVNLVAAGEVGGILDTILSRLAAYIEKAMKLKKRVKGAMVYPVTIMAIAVVVVGVILVFVIPTFAKMFADFGGELPGSDKISHCYQQLPHKIHYCDNRCRYRSQHRYQKILFDRKRPKSY